VKLRSVQVDQQENNESKEENNTPIKFATLRSVTPVKQEQQQQTASDNSVKFTTLRKTKVGS
jgi:hypothetical protein